MGGQGVNRQTNNTTATTNSANTNSSVRPNQNAGNISNSNPPQSQTQNQPFNFGNLFSGLMSGQNMR